MKKHQVIRLPKEMDYHRGRDMGIIIKNGTIVTADEIYKADITVKGEKISTIGVNLPKGKNDTLIDASGKYVFPGGIDAHVHFELPLMGTVSTDDFRTGTIAAICGGTTTIIDFVKPEMGESLNDALKLAKARAQEKAVADYGFHMIIIEYNESMAEEIPSIIKQGITSFKCFMAYKGALQIEDAQLIAFLFDVSRYGVLVALHAENGEAISALTKRFLGEGKTSPEYHWRSRPVIVEAEAIHRAAAFSNITGQPIYIVHLSSGDGLQEIAKAVSRGYKVFAETCPQYLLLSSDLYLKPEFEGAKYVMSPPIRPASHQEKLWEGLRQGYIQVVGSDHAPFNFHCQKEMGRNDFTKIPNGIPGVGDRFNLLYTFGVRRNRISLNRFVEVISTAPAKIFGMYPRKGSIIVGGDADLVIFDPRASGEVSVKNSYHNVDYSAYEGLKLKGLPSTVLLRGRLAVRDGEYIGQQGKGQFIPRSISGKSK